MTCPACLLHGGRVERGEVRVAGCTCAPVPMPFIYLCAACGSTARTSPDQVDSGTTLRCDRCAELTVVDLDTPKARTAKHAEVARLREALSRFAERECEWAVAASMMGVADCDDARLRRAGAVICVACQARQALEGT